jgi:hypothetical protein
MPDYGVIQSLPYLDQVVQETLRLHAPLGTIIRSCTKDYVLQAYRIHRNFSGILITFSELFSLRIGLKTVQKWI